MKKIIITGLMALVIVACTDNKQFTVEGTIEGAQDSTLYLYNQSLSGPELMDSVKLGSDGKFSFKSDAPDAPDFYVLLLHNQIINFSIDSTETVTINAKYPGMGSNYTVTGSDNCEKIRQLALLQQDLQRRAMALERNGSLTQQQRLDSLQTMVNEYKDITTQQYIYVEPQKAYAYFALFQTLGNQLIFNPRQNSDDIKVFAAVATSWDTYYPEALRGKNLHNIAIEGMKNQRIVEARNQDLQIEASKVNTANLIDIALTDNKGQVRHLTDLTGKVVLLDFHLFATRESTERIMMLRELYNKYHDRGFEIYQVSIDPDEHFWKTQTAALPWISVRDGNGANSPVLVNYNVQSIPTYFLIDRTNTLHKRDVQMKDLNAEIQSLL